MGQSMDRLIRAAAGQERPFSAQLELTYRCNWRCVFCYNPRHFDREGMALADWERVFDDLRDLGTMNLTLTGGEPLEHPEFFEIAEAARRRHFAIRIYTNGSLIDEALAARIAALYPFTVEMSLHGATPETHDKATCRPGSQAAMLRGLDALQGLGVTVVLKTPVTSINEHELGAMIAMVSRLGVPYKIDPNITARDDGDPKPLDWAPSREAMRAALEIGLRTETVHPVERTPGGINCKLGTTVLTIDPEGNVFPCHQWRHASIGNVKVTPLREMWFGSEVRAEARQIARQANDMLVERGGALADRVHHLAERLGERLHAVVQQLRAVLIE